MSPESPHPGDRDAVDEPPDPVDDLASAHLDGELADPDEIARARTDPDVTARLETFREMSTRVGAAPVGTSETERDDQINAALAALGSEATDGQTGQAPLTSPGDEVGARRRRRRARPRWLPSPAVAATVLALLAVVGLTLALVDVSGQDAQTAVSGGAGRSDATTGEDLGAESREDQAGAGQAGRASNDAASGEELGSAPADSSDETITVADLGSFASQSELTTALGEVDPVTLDPPDDRGTRALERAAVDRCEDALVAIPETDLEARTGVAAAELAGERVLIYANRARNGPGSPQIDQISVIEPTQCEVLFAVQP